MKKPLEDYLKQLEQLSMKGLSLGRDFSFNDHDEEDDFDKRSKEQEMKHKDASHQVFIENEQQNTRLRLEFAYMVFWLTVWTLVIIAF
jgi:hypothetical protein